MDTPHLSPQQISKIREAIAWLRANPDRQTRQQLYDPQTACYCVDGVLCMVGGFPWEPATSTTCQGFKIPNLSNPCRIAIDESTVLSDIFFNGIPLRDEIRRESERGYSTLWELNDRENWTFAQFADFFERLIQKYGRQPQTSQTSLLTADMMGLLTTATTEPSDGGYDDDDDSE